MKKMLFIIGCVFLFSGCATTDSAISAITETTDSAISAITETTEVVVPEVKNAVQEVVNTQISDNAPEHNDDHKPDCYHHHHHKYHKHHKHSGKKASSYRKAVKKKTKFKIKPKHHKLKKH